MARVPGSASAAGLLAQRQPMYMHDSYPPHCWTEQGQGWGLALCRARQSKQAGVACASYTLGFAVAELRNEGNPSSRCVGSGRLPVQRVPLVNNCRSQRRLGCTCWGVDVELYPVDLIIHLRPAAYVRRRMSLFRYVDWPSGGHGRAYR